nr:hypothetical protein [Tanacetum cinerariifolium]
RLKKDSDSLHEGFNHFRSTPSKFLTKHVFLLKATSKSESQNCPTENRLKNLPVGDHLRKDLGLLGLVLSTPVEDKPLESELTTFLVMTRGCETVIEFVLTLALTLLGNMSYLSDFEELNGGYVAFGGNPKGGKITGKGHIKTGKLGFDDVYFVKELKFNLFSVSQMDLTCLFAKATLDESNLWHRRLGHVNFKTINKLVKGNLVRGLPKAFTNDNSCVACKKGNQHRASCKSKTGIKREFSVPRTPQQNAIAEKKNRTLIEAARTLLADSLLPIPFWAEAV